MDEKKLLEKGGWKSGKNVDERKILENTKKHCNFSCQAEEVMTKRNEELKKENKIPYTVLLPSRIPAGISIWSLEKKELLFMRDLLNDDHLVCTTLCFCPPGSPLVFQFDHSDGRLTDAGNIVSILFAFHLYSWIYYRSNLRLKVGLDKKLWLRYLSVANFDRKRSVGNADFLNNTL